MLTRKIHRHESHDVSSAAGERADRDRRSDRRAPHAERRPALPAVELLREQRERGREHDRAADALNAARDDQEERIVREPAERRGDREEDDADQEQPLAPEEIREGTRRQDARREAERVGVHHPLQVGERGVERPLDRGEGDIHDRDVEQQHERRRANGHQRPPLARHRATYTGHVQQTLDVSNAVAAELAGISDGVLDALNERLRCNVRLRGNQLTLEGDDSQVAEARAVIDELVDLVEGGHQIGSHTVDAVLGTLEAGQDVREVFDAVVWRHRGKKIAPKTLTQKQYVDSIRRATVTFGIGPAGTGKTYLAMALAVAALHEREVARIILTRPAVEAGERLGFLPGDLMAKVDPYLRPLFDALYDMLDPDKANT